MGVAPVFRTLVAPVFGVAVAAVFGAAFEVLGVSAYADTEQAEKAKAKAMMKIDFITFAPISSGNNLTLQPRGLSAKFDAARSRLSERSRDVPGSGN